MNNSVTKKVLILLTFPRCLTCSKPRGPSAGGPSRTVRRDVACSLSPHVSCRLLNENVKVFTSKLSVSPPHDREMEPGRGGRKGRSCCIQSVEAPAGAARGERCRICSVTERGPIAGARVAWQRGRVAHARTPCMVRVFRPIRALHGSVGGRGRLYRSYFCSRLRSSASAADRSFHRGVCECCARRLRPPAEKPRCTSPATRHGW